MVLNSNLLVLLLCATQVFSQTDQSTGQCLSPYTYQCIGQNHFRQCSFSGPTGDIFPCSLIKGHTCYPYEYDKTRACGNALPNCTAEGAFPILESGIQVKCMAYQLCSSTGVDGVFKSDLMECRPGNEFSKSEKKCVKEDYADCSIPYATTLPSTVSTLPTTLAATTQPPPMCPSTGQYKIADMNDCRYFYNCIEGVANRSKCPLSTLFNTATSTCGSNVDCGSRFNPLSTTTTSTTAGTIVSSTVL